MLIDQLVRLTTAFNRTLQLTGATVQSAAFTVVRKLCVLAVG